MATNTPKKRRERRHACGRYVRFPGKGHKVQLRWWCHRAGHAGGSVNCGLYDELTAERVRAEIASRTARHAPTALGIWRAVVEAIDHLRARGYPVPAEVLPKWVHRRRSGGYCARVTKGGRVIELPGPFKTPEAAHNAMLDKLNAEFPPR